jgi:uncharacterized Zn finger protein
MKPIRRGTIECPECGCAALIRILFMRFAFVRCPKCGRTSAGKIAKRRKEDRQESDCVVRMGKEGKP